MPTFTQVQADMIIYCMEQNVDDFTSEQMNDYFIILDKILTLTDKTRKMSPSVLPVYYTEITGCVDLSDTN